MGIICTEVLTEAMVVNELARKRKSRLLNPKNASI